MSRIRKTAAMFLLLILMTCLSEWSSSTACATSKIASTELSRFKAKEAHQAVAVSKDSVYAITNRSIARFDKVTNKQITAWTALKTPESATSTGSRY